MYELWPTRHDKTGPYTHFIESKHETNNASDDLLCFLLDASVCGMSQCNIHQLQTECHGNNIMPLEPCM